MDIEERLEKVEGLLGQGLARIARSERNWQAAAEHIVQLGVRVAEAASARRNGGEMTTIRTQTKEEIIANLVDIHSRLERELQDNIRPLSLALIQLNDHPETGRSQLLLSFAAMEISRAMDTVNESLAALQRLVPRE